MCLPSVTATPETRVTRPARKKLDGQKVWTTSTEKIGWQRERSTRNRPEKRVQNMSEESNTEAETDIVEAEETEEADQKSGVERTYTTADIDRIIERRLDRERAKYADYDKLKSDAAELAALREADQAEIAAAIERAEAAEQRVTQAEFEAVKAKVAATKGVPTAALIGTTEDELLASADELIAWRDQNKQPSTPPKRTPSTSSGLKSGATGNENSNPDPKVAAAEALRRLRNDG